MCEASLGRLSILFIHQYSASDVESVMDEFAHQHTRRPQLPKSIWLDGDDSLQLITSYKLLLITLMLINEHVCIQWCTPLHIPGPTLGKPDISTKLHGAKTGRLLW